ncbi:MAG: proteasome accessory factor PafA2 family protein, partial [Planctomycetota bacterium]
MIIPRPTGRPSWRNIAADRLLKVCGMDAELGNFILGRKSSTSLGSGAEASRLLLKEIPGVKTESRGLTQDSGGTSSWSGWVSPPAPSTTHGSPWLYGSGGDSSYTEPASSPSGGYGAGYGYGAYGFPSYNPQDWGRKFLASNGGCFYIDLSHLEVCLPEVTSAFDHVACWHAMLLIARQALEDANALLPRGETIKVLVNNSDGKGSSYGSHLNFLLTRQGWENIFHRKLHHMLFLASHLTSSIVYSGSGKVGSEDGAPPVDYQLSQRADFFRSLCAPQTTYDRPIVNSRDESLADHETMARLHVIFFDSTLCHVASLLKVGVTQIIVAMIEQEFVDPRLILDDPLEALLLWSHDVDLRATARLTTGEQYRAVDVQWAFHELARRFVDEGGAEGVVPRAAEILSIWEETLRRLDSDVDSLASHVDWVLKRSIL